MIEDPESRRVLYRNSFQLRAASRSTAFRHRKDRSSGIRAVIHATSVLLSNRTIFKEQHQRGIKVDHLATSLFLIAPIQRFELQHDYAFPVSRLSSCLYIVRLARSGCLVNLLCPVHTIEVHTCLLGVCLRGCACTRGSRMRSRYGLPILP